MKGTSWFWSGFAWGLALRTVEFTAIWAYGHSWWGANLPHPVVIVGAYLPIAWWVLRGRSTPSRTLRAGVAAGVGQALGGFLMTGIIWLLIPPWDSERRLSVSSCAMC